MRWNEIVEWIIIIGGLVSLWPVVFMESRPDWYPSFLIAVLVLMAVVAIIRIRRLRRAFREQQQLRKR
jgi:MFS superfamily sulfate permease-like transporter